MNAPIPAAVALAREGRMPSGEWPPTEKQIDFARELQRQLRLSNALLDAHCQRTYRAGFGGLGKQSMSKLIDELKGWRDQYGVPDALRVAAGQRRLFEAPR